MQLVEDSNSPVSEPFDHIAFPERLAAVEQPDVQVADELHQLLWRTWTRKRDVAYMVSEVDGIDRHPLGQAAER